MNRADIGRAILHAVSTTEPLPPLVVRAMAEEILRLRSITDEIHAWAVCGCIADAEDMMKNIERVCDITAPTFEGSGQVGEVAQDRIDRVRAAKPAAHVCEICKKPVLDGQPRYGPTGNHYDCEPNKTSLGAETAAMARARMAVNNMDDAIERAKKAFASLERQQGPSWRTRGRSGR